MPPAILKDEAKAENEDFINKIDENIKKIIKEQVKVQVKEQVSKILPRIEKSVNKQLEAKVLIHSSNEAKTSHVVATNLSELELKKILIDKMENNKSINRSVQQKTLYKALVDAYETDKDILATYRDISYRLKDEAKAENEDFINKIDENIKKIIKEQVKVQVKEQVSKILPRIKNSVNEQLEAKVLIHLSNEAKTSYAVAANLSELETLYKALVDAYETDKEILATYEDTVTLKRRRDDEDEDDEPFVGSNRWSKRRKARKEPESTSVLKDKTFNSAGSSKEGSKSKTRSTGKSTQAEEQVNTVKNLEEPTHQEFEIGFTKDHHISTFAQNEEPRGSFNEQIDTPLDYSAFVLNRLKVDTLTLELLAGLTFELMKGSCKSLMELEYFLKEVYKATTNQLDWNNPKGQQYPHDMHKPLLLIPNSREGRYIPTASLIFTTASVVQPTQGVKIEDFVPMGSKEEGERFKRNGLSLEHESPKKMKTAEDVSEEDLKQMMQLVPVEEVYVEALQVKHPIIDWEIHTEGQRTYWKIIRLGGSTAVYQFFIDMGLPIEEGTCNSDDKQQASSGKLLLNGQ
nr:hypothetical protein [Tanacetum cinerariifolium]